MKRFLLFGMMILIATVLYADQYEKWIEEDVKVLITREEKEAFKKLKTEEEKEKFIQDFWTKRDPSAGTPENEFKSEYEHRLQIVNEKLKGGRKKPVDTDMGQTLLLLGPSSEQKVEKTDPPRQTWIYTGLPEGIGTDVTIEFVGDPEQGGFKFAESKKAKEILEKARNYYARLSEIAAAQKSTQPAKPAEPIASQAAPVTDPALKAALDGAAEGNPSKDVTVNLVTDSFMTSRGEIFAAVAVSGNGEKIGIRILDGAKQIVKEMEVPFVNPFMVSIDLTPGNYTLLAAVSSGGKIGTAEQPLNVPDYGAKFSVSSLIFVKDFQQVEAKPEKEPFAFGRYKLIPSFDRVYSKTDQNGLRVMYEVYNFQSDPATGQPDLEVVTTLQLGKEKPKQTAPQPVKGFAIGKKMTVPTGYGLETLPAGEYKITLTITDKVSKQTASSEGTFTIQ